MPAPEVSAPELELWRSSLLMHRWRGQRQMGSGASEGVSRWQRLSPTAGVNDGDEWRWGATLLWGGGVTEWEVGLSAAGTCEL